VSTCRVSILSLSLPPPSLQSSRPPFLVPSGGITMKRRCTYRPAVIYLIVNKLLSLFSLSLSPPFPPHPRTAERVRRRGAEAPTRWQAPQRAARALRWLPTLKALRHRRGGARLSAAVGVPALEGHSSARGEGLKAASALQGVGHLLQGLLDRGIHLGVHRGPQLRVARRYRLQACPFSTDASTFAARPRATPAPLSHHPHLPRLLLLLLLHPLPPPSSS
jgi:hypothetical protein